MSKNYVVINGQKAELTKEQVRLLGFEERNNPFDRVGTGQEYYSFTDFSGVLTYSESNKNLADKNYEIANYFNDREFAEQVTLRQLLYRKLLKFTYDNECEDTAEWDLKNMHYYIYYNYYHHEFDADVTGRCKTNIVYFSSRSAAEQAIKEVVEPFMKEHPDFVW